MNYPLIRKQLESYLRFETGHSPRSVHKYLLEFDRLILYLNEYSVALDQVDQRVLRGYMSQRANELNRLTYANIVALLKTIFSYLDYDELVVGNPAQHLKSPKGINRRQIPVFLTAEQQALLRNYLTSLKRNFTNDRDHTLFALFLYTGMRTSEACTLLRSAYHQQLGAIQITRKGGKEQILPLAPQLEEALQTYWLPHMAAINSPFFLSRLQGQQLTPYLIWQRISTHLNKAGIILPKKRGAHALRHTFASNLVRKGVNLIEIQQLLGHSDISITQIYTHTTAEGLRDAIKKLD
ncbi:tyrosine-type recombinase/integrase [Chrysiogenes arsenatis]|uniref:tyrosine-type recombinase/integrase n=1 Tax=Chrysiogenes arsenatis TaxID=309797 RepID=UPI000410FF05|nr:tyrosine-type recombinase/integrase [Chrysiogenes arsenatis]